MVHTHSRSVCAECRWVGSSESCPFCHKEAISVHHRWRAPKKNNDAAWKLIINGDVMWDKKAVNKKLKDQYMTRWHLDGTQYCHLGHKLVPPNVIYYGFDKRYATCASCRQAAMLITKNKALKFKDHADEIYSKMEIQ